MISQIFTNEKNIFVSCSSDIHDQHNKRNHDQYQLHNNRCSVACHVTHSSTEVQKVTEKLDQLGHCFSRKNVALNS